MKNRIFFVLAVFFVVFSMWSTIYEYNRRDDIRPERYFELVHNFPTDFNFYRSRIRQGIEGRTTVVEQYTSEPHNGSYMHVFYLALGWAGRWTRTPWHLSSDVYHMARIVLGMTMMLATAAFAKKSFGWPANNASRSQAGWQLIAFFLAVTASTWPQVVTAHDGWRFGGFMPWWSVMDSLQRVTHLPHLVAGQVLILFLLMQLADHNVLSRWWNWVFLGTLGFALGIIFPPGILFIYGTIMVLVVVELLYKIREGKKRKLPKGYLKKLIIPRFIFGVISLPAMIYLQLMLSFYPWKRLAEFDITNPLPFKYGEYILAMGPMLPLGLIGLIFALVKKEKQMILSIAWVLAWIVFMIVFDWIPQQSPLRFSEMLPHVPLAILTTYLFTVLYGKIVPFKKPGFGTLLFGDVSRKSAVRSRDRRTPYTFKQFVDQLKKFSLARSLKQLPAALIVFTVPVGLSILGVGIMHSSWKWQRDFIDHKIRAGLPLVPTGSYVMYPLKDFVSAIGWLQDATTRDTVVLAGTTAGNYIPVYSGNRVYVGHANTVHMIQKEDIVDRFYAGNMGEDDAYAWIRDANIRVVFHGPQEVEEGGIHRLEEVYTFLVPAHENGFIRMYWIDQEWTP